MRSEAVNFEFSEEQNLLRDQAASFLATKSPLAVARRVLEGDESYDAGLWNQIAQLGWTATTIPDSYQGAGLGYLELCVMAEELGRMLTPVPFSSSVYLASPALLQFGSEAQKEAWLPRLALGKAIGCLAIAEGVGEVSPANISLTERQGKLTGEKILVPDGDFADVAVVIARSGSTHSLLTCGKPAYRDSLRRPSIPVGPMPIFALPGSLPSCWVRRGPASSNWNRFWTGPQYCSHSSRSGAPKRR
jgi:acyl-CoA dehydrogenase